MTRARKPTRSPDLVIYGQSGDTVFLLRPVSRLGTSWIADRIQPEATWFGGAVVVDHRYIADVLRGAVAEGLKVA